MESSQQLDQLAATTIAAAMEVHRRLGPGFLEAVYEEALAIELDLRGIPFTRQAPIAVVYKGHPVGEGRLDLLVAHALIVELKAIDALAPIHIAQVMSCLRATGHPLALLINFNVPVLKHGVKRITLPAPSVQPRQPTRPEPGRTT